MRKTANYWTKERVHKVALKYKYRGEFSKKEPAAYTKAVRSGWLKYVCCHMTYKKSHLGKRAIYVYEFEDKSF